MGHQETYAHDRAYTEWMARQPLSDFKKYVEALKPRGAGSVLDVGCGVGQALRILEAEGSCAFGVEVSRPSVEEAVGAGLEAQLYDGRKLPFPDEHFEAVGARNVLEHVEEPESLIEEMVRVTASSGRLVVSSPNFFRVLGFRDYHPRMRGLGNKLGNLRRLLLKARRARRAPESMAFDRMLPMETAALEPDRDAIIATNPVDLSFFASSPEFVGEVGLG
jgi:SAM-dependent methyltransferase